MTKYTVVGVYREPLGQRYATTVEADSPQEAEVEAHQECCEANGTEDSGLLVAAVIEGEIEPVDVAYTDGYSFGVPVRS